MCISSNVAERAIAVSDADESAREQMNAAAEERRRGQAISKILIWAENAFGIRLSVDDVRTEGTGRWLKYVARVVVDPDATLYFIVDKKWDSATSCHRDRLSVTVRPADQIYYDLAPGVEVNAGPGGIYGHFGLQHLPENIDSLEQLGSVLKRIRVAREQWRRKHGVLAPPASQDDLQALAQRALDVIGSEDPLQVALVAFKEAAARLQQVWADGGYPEDAIRIWPSTLISLDDLVAEIQALGPVVHGPQEK